MCQNNVLGYTPVKLTKANRRIKLEVVVLEKIFESTLSFSNYLTGLESIPSVVSGFECGFPLL